MSLPLPLEPSGAEAAGDDPTLRISARTRKIRMRRLLLSSSNRTWCLELEIEVPLSDPEEILAASEGFLVDAADGRNLGVVDLVELGPSGAVSALVVSRGWFGRRRARIGIGAIDTILPGERRIIVRA